MENSSKALLIVAAVLIAIILIAFGIRIFNSQKDVSTEAEGVGASITHQTEDATESLGAIFDVQREFTMGGTNFYPIQEQEQGQNNYGDWLINNVEDLVIFAKFINVENLSNEEKKKIPAEIDTPEDMSNKIVVLNNDLDFNLSSIENWTPIGKDGNHKFEGIFDGKGHTIKNIKINRTYDYTGLFGYANTIKNLKLEGGIITGKNYVGGIAGYANTMQNCENIGGNVAGKNYVGGIVGYANSINNCNNNSNITAKSYIGGISGLILENGNVSKCSNSGNIINDISERNDRWNDVVGGYDDAIGGIVGYVYRGGNISECNNFGEIKAEQSFNVGGIAGITAGSTNLCNNTGDITAKFQLGGILGSIAVGNQNVSTNISNCSNSGTIKAVFYADNPEGSVVGGIVGWTSETRANGIIENNYNSGKIIGQYKGSKSVGGIIGRNSYKFVLNNLYNIGEIEITGEIGEHEGRRKSGGNRWRTN